MIAFLDSNALINLLEGHPRLGRKVRACLRDILETVPTLRTAVSRMTQLECRVGPMKTGDLMLLSSYDAFFARPDLIVVELTADVVDLATAIRVRHGLKTPDALQAACCLQLGNKHLFLTGDRIFKRVAGLQTELVG